MGRQSSLPVYPQDREQTTAHFKAKDLADKSPRMLQHSSNTTLELLPL